MQQIYCVLGGVISYIPLPCNIGPLEFDVFFVFWRRKMAEYNPRMWRNLQWNIQKNTSLVIKMYYYVRLLPDWRMIIFLSLQE